LTKIEKAQEQVPFPFIRLFLMMAQSREYCAIPPNHHGWQQSSIRN
jgi:hypothetical protein